jgi:F-type H+-transporting ATPase subunit b
MPQISQLSATYASQIFWLLVTFGAVFLVVGRGMVPKVQATISARDQSVASDLAAAEAARRQADAQEEAWRAQENAARESAQRLIAEARAESVAATEATLASAGAGTAARVADAEARIAGASASAMQEIELVAAEAAQAIVAKVSGAVVGDDEAQRAVRMAMSNG